MSKIKKYIEEQIDKCDNASVEKNYYITYSEVMNMVYLNEAIDITCRTNRNTKTFVYWDKIKEELIEATEEEILKENQRREKENREKIII